MLGNLNLLTLSKSPVLANGTEVVKQSQHDTTIRQLNVHVDKSLANASLVAVYRAQVGDNQRNVMRERNDCVSALIRFQVVCDYGQRVQDAGLFILLFLLLLLLQFSAARTSLQHFLFIVLFFATDQHHFFYNNNNDFSSR